MFSVVLVGVDINCFKEYKKAKSKYSVTMKGIEFSFELDNFFSKTFSPF